VGKTTSRLDTSLESAGAELLVLGNLLIEGVLAGTPDLWGAFEVAPNDFRAG
jgi:hypothetical protein